MAHAQKPDFVFRRNRRVHLNRRGVSVQSTTGSRVVRISGSNAGYTMFWGSVKSTGYPLHSPVSPFTSSPRRHRVSSHFNWSLPPLFLDCVWNVMAHAQKPDFVFRRNGRVHLNRQWRQFSRLMAGELSTQPAGFVLLVQACVLQSCDAYWLPTPLSCFPFTSPSVRHRVPSHFNWTLPLSLY